MVTTLLLGSTSTVPVAWADPDPTNDVRDPKYNEDEYLPFYTPPDPLPEAIPAM